MYTVFACISSAGIGALRANAPVGKVTARNDKRRIDKIRRMATLLKVHPPSRLKEHSEAVDRRMVLAVETRNNGLGINGAAPGPPQRPFDCNLRWPTRVRLFHFAHGSFFCGGGKSHMSALPAIRELSQPGRNRSPLSSNQLPFFPRILTIPLIPSPAS